MRFKPKTVRRLLLLAVVVALVVGVAFSLFFVRRWQIDRRTLAHRTAGLAAQAAGQDLKALEELTRFIHRSRAADAEVWLAYAQARRALEEPDFSHLREAVKAYQQYLALRPDDAVQRMALLKLANQAGQFLEARDAAEQLRPATIAQCGPNHIEVLREEAIALTASKLYAPRLDSVIQRLLELAPLDLQGNIIRLEVWSKTGRTLDARRVAEELVKAHPDDATARMIAGASYILEPTADNIRIARVKLAQAVGLDPASAAPTDDAAYPNAEFVSRAVDLTDRISAFDLSLATLKRWNSRRPGVSKDPMELGLLRTLARRLWQQGEFAEAIALVDPANAAAADSEVLAFRALCMLRTKEPLRKSEAGAIVEILRSRSDDFRAKAWVVALPLADPSRTPDHKSDAESLKAAVKASNRVEPVFMVMLGDAYAALARMDDARQLWRDAADSPPCMSWAYPLVRIAETFLAEGRVDEAGEAATSAVLISPTSPMVNALWFDAQAAKLQRGSPEAIDPVPLLATLERIISQVESATRTDESRAIWERMLPPRVLLLVRTGKRHVAVQTVRSVLDGPQPISDRTLQRLASVSVSERLGFESECLSRAASIRGASPSVTFARAMELAENGKTEEGLALLRDAAASKTPESRLALARFLESTGNPGAMDAWITLSNEFASDVNIQRACLGSVVLAGDAAFIEKTIARYQALSGREPTTEDAVVRIARAHVLLHGTPSAKDRDAAVAILAQLVMAQPKLIEPKLVMARALLLSDTKRGIQPQPDRAAMQLRDALALEPRSAPIALELASVLQRTREFGQALELLVKLAQDRTADPAARHGAARLLIVQGGDALAPALQTLQALDQEWSARNEPTPPVVLSELAEVYVLQRDDDKATQVYSRLVASPTVSTEQVYMAARFHQRTGRTIAFQHAMEKLDAMTAGPAAKTLVRARLAEDRGDGPGATRLFEEAVSTSAGDAECWRQYISALLARSRSGEAAAVAERAVKALPSDGTLAILLEQARLASATTDGAGSLAPLIAALSKDPNLAGPADVLRSIDEAWQRGDLNHPDKITELADRFSTVPAVQMFLAQRLAGFDADRSVALVGRARTQAPADPKIAKSAAEVYLALGRWSDMLSAATVWRDRDPSRSAEPDIAIAQARLNLLDYKGGIVALKPWVEQAAAAPDTPTSLSVLNMQTRLLVASGRETEARDLLGPLLPTSSNVRTSLWLRCAAEALPSVEVAREWLDRVRPIIAIDAADEHLAVAGALSMLATRFREHAPTLLVEARTYLQGLTGRTSTATASVWEALGVVCHRLDDIEGAAVAYERALALDPRRIICLNNLASLLSDQGRELDQALGLAQRAVEVSPDLASLGTLGSIQHAIGERERKSGTGNSAAAFKQAAATYLRIARARPMDPEAWSRAAQASSDAGDFEGAADAWQRLAGIATLQPAGQAAAKNNLAAVLLRMEPTRERLERARASVLEALSLEDEPAYRDTLGWVELASGKRDRAIETFRRAIGPKGAATTQLKSAVVGLATALAAGSPEERKEAAVLAASVDAKDMDSYLAQKLQQLRTLVAVEKP